MKIVMQPFEVKLPSFHDRALLQRALTHRSYVNENPGAQHHNERLEFLGDAILNFLCGEFLYQTYPHKAEGELTPLRSQLVDAKQLAMFAQLLDLGSQLRLGRGADRDGGRTNLRMLSSAFEAIVGAYFLDGHSDIEPVRQFVVPFFEMSLVASDSVDVEPAVNYKSLFQEWALATHQAIPKYRVIKETGMDHAKTFTIVVQVNDETCGQGTGRKKQEAEKAAARAALDRLGLL